MSAFAWLRRPGCPSSPPEASSAGRRSAACRPATPDSFHPASAHGGVAASARSAVRRLRPALAAALLCLPLLAGLAPEAAAQTIDSSTITEGETKTFTVSGIPQTWTGTVSYFDNSSATALTLNNCGALAFIPNVDACFVSTPTWDSSARTYSFQIMAVTDSDTEGDETFVFDLTDSDDSSRTATFTITIKDVVGSSLPEITIAPKTTGSVTEGGNLEYTLTASSAPTSALSVSVAAANPAGASYVTTTLTSVEIAANSTSADYTVTTSSDSTDEPNGPVTVTVQTGTGYTVGTMSSASVTVNDNDATQVTLARLAGESGDVTEGGAMKFTVTLFRGLYDGEVLPVPLTFATGSGQAIRGTDYTLDCSVAPTVSCANLNDPNATATVTFTGPSSGTSANTLTLELRAINDGSVEGDETVNIGLGTLNASSGTNLGGGASATDNLASFDILNQDLATGEFKVTFDSAVFQFPESDGFATITGSFSPPPVEDGTVRFRYDGLTATANRDYRAVHSIGYRADQTKFTFRVPLVQDALIESNEFVRITRLDPPDGVTAGLTDLIILNSDAPIVSAFPSAVAGEPVRVLLRMATAGVRSKGPAVVRVETVESSAAGVATEGTDYTAVDRNVTIPAGVPFAWVEIPTVADADTAVETFTLKFSLVSYAGTTYAPEYWPNNTSQGATTATIRPSGTAAPAVPAIAIEADPAEVQEGGEAVFTLTARPKPAAPLMVSVMLVPAGGNFLAPEHRGRELVAVIDAATGTGTLAVPTLEDSSDRNGTIIADLIPREFSKIAAVMQSPPYRVQGFQSKPRAVLTVTDRKVATARIANAEIATPPTLTIAADTAQVTEGGEVSFTISADKAPQHNVEVYVTAEERMGAGGDTIAVARSEPLTFPAGATSVKWSFTAYSDEDARADGTIEAQIDPDTAWPASYEVGDPSTATMALIDDDGPSDDGGTTDSVGTQQQTPLIVDPALVAEVRALAGQTHHGTAHVTRWRRVLVAFGVESYPGVSAITAAEAEANAENYSSPLWPQIAKLLADAEAAQNTQNTAESPEPENAPQDAPENAPVIKPAVTIAANSPAITEGADAAFTLTATPAPQAPLAVTLQVSADGDYGIPAGERTVTIPTGGSYTLTLPTPDDATDEPHGRVAVTVQAGSGYTVGSPASDSIAIRDDDLPPPVITISAKAASVTEGTDAVFTVTADRAPAVDLPVQLAVSESGDHIAAQYEGAHTATLAKGTITVEMTIPTVNDNADEPNGTVTATLKGGSGYTLGSTTSAPVIVVDDDASGLPALSIPQTLNGHEGQSVKVTVTLSRPAQERIRLWLGARESAPASATGRDDFIADGYWVVFQPGQTVQNRWWYLFDDSHDDGGETFEVYIAHVSGPAAIGNGVTIVTIENDDPLPAAWLKRLGRTVAQQALDGVAARIAAPREAGMQGTLAGQALRFAPTNDPDGTATDESPVGASGLPVSHAALAIAHGFDPDPSDPSRALRFRTMTARDALLGSSFSLTGGKDSAGGNFAFWGRAAQAGFDGVERGDGTDISLDGTVTTALLGADYARDSWLAGIALVQSDAEGDYAALGAAGCPAGNGRIPALCDGAIRAGDGRIEASSTAAVPYASVQASERVQLWGALGTGSGEITVRTATRSYPANTRWSMAAMGLRSEWLDAASGPSLALTADALWSRSSSEQTRDLAASESDTTRLRLGIEGGWQKTLDNGARLTPKLSVGVRQDSGDAESGFGIELGGGLAWSHADSGWSMDLSGRTLLAHEDADFKDRGWSAALTFDPDPKTRRGPSLTVRQDFGGLSRGGLDALFAPDPLAERAGSADTPSRWSAEVATGLAARDGRWTASPYIGWSLAAQSREYTLGWRLTPETATDTDFSFGVRATHRVRSTQAPLHLFGIELRMSW